MKNAIYAIGRLENDYVREWVEYHLNIGFHKIFIYDNNYSGEEEFSDVLKDYIEQGKVKIINVRNKFSFQEIAYNNAINEYCRDYDWNAFIDIDEFITIENSRDINEFLSQEKFINKDIIIMNWKNYGDNEQVKKEKGGVIERFTTPIPNEKCIAYDFSENLHIKSMINGKSKYIKDIMFGGNPHNLYPKSKDASELIQCVNGVGKKVNNFATPFSEKIVHNGIYLRHYSCKTIEEFIKIKLQRGFCEGKLNLSLDWFWKRNKITNEKLELANNLIKKISNGEKV